MQLDGAVTSLDPALGASFQDGVVDSTLYDPLIHMDADGQIVAGVASEWTSTPDSATFTIREDVTCSDGTAVTAEIVANSLARFFDPETGAPLLGSVIGATNAATATADGSTVTVQLESPFSGLLRGMTLPQTGIVCPSGLEDLDSLTTGSAGTGPYVAVSQVTGDSYVFEAHEAYAWGPDYSDTPTAGERPDKLTLQVVADESTRANLQETGELDIAGYASDGWTRFEDGDYTMTASPQSETFLVFNATEGRPTAAREVREAIARSIDRERLNEVQSYGAGELIVNLGQPDYECYDTSVGDLIPTQDVAAAEQVLQGEKIKVIGTKLLAGGDAQAYVLSALQEAGADASLENMNNEAWVSELFTPRGDWDVSILVYSNAASDMLSAGSFFVGPQPPEGQNLGGVDNPEAEAALAEALVQTSEESCAALSEFQRALVGDVNVIPLASAPNTVVFASGMSAAIRKGFVRTGTIRVE